MRDFETLAKQLGPQPAAYNGGPTLEESRPFTLTQEGETCQQRERRLLAAGWHPTGIAPLATLPPGAGRSCRDCAMFAHLQSGSKARPKCERARARWTLGRATDCLASFPACERFEPRADQTGATS